MALRQQKTIQPSDTPRRVYAFVDSVIDADPARPHSRMSLQLDAVDANAFDEKPSFIDHDDSLLLARVSTTPRRFEQLFGSNRPKEGDWLEIKLGRRPLRPRAWQLPATDNYSPERSTNIVGLTPLEHTSEIVSRLEDACDVAGGVVSKETADSLAVLLSTGASSDLRITALDVGQAACVTFSDGNQPLGYFDLGAPIYFNQRSFPKPFNHRPASNGFVILSHWDFDHFALALRCSELKELQWFAPKQPVGPNTARFQRSLNSNLFFLSKDIDLGPLMLRRCSGTSARDRNSTGYALRVDLGDAGVLLPGDADYQWIPTALANGVNRIVVPHHGGTGSPPPSPGGRGKSVAVVSYGNPNTYRHPNENQVDAHRRAGWQIQRTAAHGTPIRPRGNRTLYPI
jgi:hypothetical protein